MQPTSKIRVSSDRIPKVLVFVYFCRGLLGNMEKRPTRHVYIEILRPATIFRNEMDLRSDWTEVEAERGLAQGARPRDQGARPRDQGAHPPVVPNQGPLRGLCPTDSKDRGKSRD